MSEDPYKRAYLREKQARLEAEQLLENESRELYITNQRLSELNEKLQQSHENLLTQQSVLVRNEKLASIGLLSAGVAHEINNPLAFVSSNLEMIDSYWQAMLRFYLALQTKLDSSPFSLDEEDKNQLQALIAKNDLAFIATDFDTLLKDTNDGLVRVKNIVKNLQQFSRTQESDWDLADINQGINSTLKILNYQIKGINCQVKLDLDANTKIWCNQGELNQVFLNIFQNALHAMKHADSKILSLSTHCEKDHLVIQIKDTGHGIKKAHITKILDPFFTTKNLGEGTGLGLYISYKIIQEHKGDMEIISEPNQGAKFIIQLPLNRPSTM